jgi:hypothetical protein
MTKLHAALPLAASLAFLGILATGGARAENDGQDEQGTTQAATPNDDAAREERAAPAEPVPTPAPSPPVMPTTVVTPAGVQSESPRAPAPKSSAAPTSAAASPTPATKASPAPPQRVSLGKYGEIEQREIRRGERELGRPATGSRWHGFPISLSLRDAPLPEVLRSFARLAGVNLVLAPGVTGTVTVELHDVPWDQALYVILKTQGLGAEIDGRVWVVEP